MTNAQHDAYICQQYLTDELNDLRNVAVDEGIYDSDDEGY